MYYSAFLTILVVVVANSPFACEVVHHACTDSHHPIFAAASSDSPACCVAPAVLSSPVGAKASQVKAGGVLPLAVAEGGVGPLVLRVGASAGTWDEYVFADSHSLQLSPPLRL